MVDKTNVIDEYAQLAELAQIAGIEDINEALNGDWGVEVTAVEKKNLECMVLAYMVAAKNDDEDDAYELIKKIDLIWDSKVTVKE